MRGCRLRRARGYFLAACAVTVLVLMSVSYTLLHSYNSLAVRTGGSQPQSHVVKVSLVWLPGVATSSDTQTPGSAKVKDEGLQGKDMPPRDVIVQAVTRAALPGRPQEGKVTPLPDEGHHDLSDARESRQGGANFTATPAGPGKPGEHAQTASRSGATPTGFPHMHPRLRLRQALRAPFYLSDAKVNDTLGFGSHSHYKDIAHLKAWVNTALTLAHNTLPTSGSGRNRTTSDLHPRSRASIMRALTKARGQERHVSEKSEKTDYYDSRFLSKRVKDMTLNEDDGWVDPETGEEMTQASTSRPDVCLNCFRVNFPLRMAPSDPCRDLGPGEAATLLVLITSAPRNAVARDVIRATWGATCRDRKSHVRCAFLVGEPSDGEVGLRLRAEQAEHGDLVQHGFRDAYVNLTYKTLSGLAWATSACPRVDYVMKTDDDMYVNTDLLPIMLRAAPRSEFMGGFCWGASAPNRDVSSKWYVSRQMYRKTHLPPMCSGTGYLLSLDLVYKVLAASANVPWFHLEDVYVALCLQVYGVLPHNLLGFSNLAATFDPCRFRNAIVTSHGLEPHDLARYWMALRQCPAVSVSPSELFIEIPFPQ